jgi:hypothetical protein
MKRVLLVAGLLCSVAVLAAPLKNPMVYPVALSDDGGHHISASQVPPEVLQSFNNMFPGARNVQWEVQREDGQKVYEATFTENGKRFNAEFAPGGTFLGKQRDHSGDDR